MKKLFIEFSSFYKKKKKPEFFKLVSMLTVSGNLFILFYFLEANISLL